MTTFTGNPERDAKCRAAFPALYSAIWPDLRDVALTKGYALLIHGSLSRDLDLVAVPWVKHAAPAEELVETLRATCDGWIGADAKNGEPGIKPHGRRAWTIVLHGHAIIDLSVMPRC